MIIKPAPFDDSVRKWIVYNLIVIVFMWVIGLYAYFTLPEIIPTHFGLKGSPDAYGSKFVFLILPALLSLAPAIILLIIKFRFTLINKYPYLINLPGFFAYIDKISEGRKSYWFNRYFEVLIKFNFALSIYLLAILMVIYYSTIQEFFDAAALILIIFLPFISLVPFFIALSKISNEMKSEANRNSNLIKN